MRLARSPRTPACCRYTHSPASRLLRRRFARSLPHASRSSSRKLRRDLSARIERALVAKRQRLERLRLQLDERSPLRVLERGYAICYDAVGNVVRASDDVPSAIASACS